MLSDERSLAVKEALRRAFGSRLLEVVLYGSVARDDDAGDSDIDLLLVVRGPVSLGRDIEVAVDALYPLVLEWDTLIHPLPVSEKDYETGELFFYRKARQEGVPL